MEVQIQQIPSGKEFENLRRSLSKSFVEGRSGASESSSEIQQLRQERDRNRNASKSKQGSFFRSASCENSSMRRNGSSRATKNRILHRQKFFAVEPRIQSFLNIWIGLKKKLPSCKLAAMSHATNPSLPSFWMKDISLKNWSRCK